MHNWHIWWINNDIYLSHFNLFDFLKISDNDSLYILLEQMVTNKKDLVEYLNQSYIDSREASNWFKINKIPYADYSDAKAIQSYDAEKMLEYHKAKNHPSGSFKYSKVLYDFPLVEQSEASVFEILTNTNKDKKRSCILSELPRLLYSKQYTYMNFPSFKKTYPSNGSRHTLDVFAVNNNESLYLDPQRNMWCKIENNDTNLNKSLLIITCTFERMQWKYRNHIFYRDILLELGHLKEIMSVFDICEIFNIHEKEELKIKLKKAFNINDFYTEVMCIYEI